MARRGDCEYDMQNREPSAERHFTLGLSAESAAAPRYPNQESVQYREPIDTCARRKTLLTKSAENPLHLYSKTWKIRPPIY